MARIDEIARLLLDLDVRGFDLWQHGYSQYIEAAQTPREVLAIQSALVRIPAIYEDARRRVVEMVVRQCDEWIATTGPGQQCTPIATV